jgi:hypothetical protein
VRVIIFVIANSNIILKTRFWKEKSIESVVTFANHISLFQILDLGSRV